MNQMIRWDLSRIYNHRELLINNGHGGETIGNVTYILIYASQLIKLPEISNGNFPEFYERLTLVKQHIPLRIDPNPDGADLSRTDITIEDVKRHIGLRTTADYMDSFDWLDYAKGWI